MISYEKIRAVYLIVADSILCGIPKWIDLQVTHRCNLKCVMCSTWESKDQDISLNILKKIISKAKKDGAERINIWGGEPYIRKDLPELFLFIRENGLKCKVTTNGTIISDHAMEETIKYVNNITFSIDGIGTIHDNIRGKSGTFDKVIANLDRIFNEKKTEMLVRQKLKLIVQFKN